MKNDALMKFLLHAYELLQGYPQSGRYYHTLRNADSSPLVVHDYTAQLTYVVKGNGTVYLNGKLRKISAGSIVLIEAGTTHRFLAEPEGLTLFHIHIPDEGRDGDRRIMEGEDYDRYTVEQ